MQLNTRSSSFTGVRVAEITGTCASTARHGGRAGTTRRLPHIHCCVMMNQPGHLPCPNSIWKLPTNVSSVSCHPEFVQLEAVSSSVSANPTSVTGNLMVFSCCSCWKGSSSLATELVCRCLRVQMRNPAIPAPTITSGKRMDTT